MPKLIILIDYLDRFQTKVPALPYRSGYDLILLKNILAELGYKIEVMKYSQIDFKENKFKDCFVLYTSIEDPGLFYKDFMEDILWGIKLQGGILIPRLEIFRAHHNKVFMETLRSIKGVNNTIQSKLFGSLIELQDKADTFTYPVIIKSSSGAGSRWVRKAEDKKALIKLAKKFLNTHQYLAILKEYGLLIKRLYQTKRKFKTESLYRKKIIVQNFVPGLDNDWKILIYWDKYYVMKRLNRKNDFRASGSGIFYSHKDKEFNMPLGLLDYARSVFEALDVPNVSFDIACDNNSFYLIEFQGISFGTIAHSKAQSYYQYSNERWRMKEENLSLEEVYAQSVHQYISKIQR
jgi:glutathione synthase/RimK-type ligase-like ATP-grasp enzyme